MWDTGFKILMVNKVIICQLCFNCAGHTKTTEMQTDRHRERQRGRRIEARSAGAEDRKKHREERTLTDI